MEFKAGDKQTLKPAPPAVPLTIPLTDLLHKSLAEIGEDWQGIRQQIGNNMNRMFNINRRLQIDTKNLKQPIINLDLKIPPMPPANLYRLIKLNENLIKRVDEVEKKDMGKAVRAAAEYSETESDDPITPDHYHAGGMDLWEFARANFPQEKLEGYHQISAMKYIMRAGKKAGNSFEQDIKKAANHLDELINIVETEGDVE